MDIIERIDCLLLFEAITPRDTSDKGIEKGDRCKGYRFSNFFTYKDIPYEFMADAENEDWNISFEANEGDTFALNIFGAGAQAVWSSILYCLCEFVNFENPKTFSFYGSSQSHEDAYKNPMCKRLIEKFTKYKFVREEMRNTPQGRKKCFVYEK